MHFTGCCAESEFWVCLSEDAVVISVLFCDPNGVYASIVGLDLWGQSRDARLYNGAGPIVAHPPCNLWVNLARVNYIRYGGEHNRPGNDGGMFESALRNVRRCGGVLEHPAYSWAFSAYSLPRPIRGKWGYSDGLWTTEVSQSVYGHKARKRTWLLYAGGRVPLDLDWRDLPGSHQCGWFDRNKPTLSKREASATPLAFAHTLLALAKHSKCDTDLVIDNDAPIH